MGAKFDALFKAFKESPTAAIMTLLVLAISAMFVINQKTNSSIIADQKEANKNCATEKYVLATQMERLNDKYIETFGLLKEVQSEINVLKKLGQIK